MQRQCGSSEVQMLRHNDEVAEMPKLNRILQHPDPVRDALFRPAARLDQQHPPNVHFHRLLPRTYGTKLY
jgi:hypothetical protein